LATMSVGLWAAVMSAIVKNDQTIIVDFIPIPTFPLQGGRSL